MFILCWAFLEWIHGFLDMSIFTNEHYIFSFLYDYLGNRIYSSLEYLSFLLILISLLILWFNGDYSFSNWHKTDKKLLLSIILILILYYIFSPFQSCLREYDPKNYRDPMERDLRGEMPYGTHTKEKKELHRMSCNTTKW